jgi:hypothetical protein
VTEGKPLFTIRPCDPLHHEPIEGPGAGGVHEDAGPLDLEGHVITTRRVLQEEPELKGCGASSPRARGNPEPPFLLTLGLDHHLTDLFEGAWCHKQARWGNLFMIHVHIRTLVRVGDGVLGSLKI